MDLTKIKELLADSDENYLLILFPDSDIQMVSTFDPEEVIEILEFLINAFKKSHNLHVHDGNTH